MSLERTQVRTRLGKSGQPLDIVDYGLRPYRDVWQLQKKKVDELIAGKASATLFLGSHPHVITLGRGTHEENLLAGDGLTAAGLEKPEVIQIERGGDVTYHGPGQLVGYPILDLNNRRDLHQYMRDLEEVIINTLATFHIKGRREEGLTGVWVGEKKIASIGIAVKRWVTYHGFALNVETDLRYFQWLNPCGLQASVMTSMQEETNGEVCFAEVQQSLERHFRDSRLTMHPR